MPRQVPAIVRSTVELPSAVTAGAGMPSVCATCRSRLIPASPWTEAWYPESESEALACRGTALPRTTLTGPISSRGPVSEARLPFVLGTFACESCAAETTKDDKENRTRPRTIPDALLPELNVDSCSSPSPLHWGSAKSQRLNMRAVFTLPMATRSSWMFPFECRARSTTAQHVPRLAASVQLED